MWDLEFSAETEWDFELIFDQLAKAGNLAEGNEADAIRRAIERTHPHEPVLSDGVRTKGI